MASLSYLFSCAKFIAHKHAVGFSVSKTPSFDAEALTFFGEVIRESKSYLEYGSGGSTILASQFVDRLVSIESDRIFSEAVRRALPQRHGINLLTVDIGATRDWGYPVFGRPTKARTSRWQKYPQAPWNADKHFLPDTILIDGRFRIACALESLLHGSQSTRIIVDDYLDRPYGEIEKYANLVSMHGRMAEFRKRTDFDVAACNASLKISYADIH